VFYYSAIKDQRKESSSVNRIFDIMLDVDILFGTIYGTIYEVALYKLQYGYSMYIVTLGLLCFDRYKMKAYS